MFTKYSELNEYISNEGVQALDLRYVDFNGRWRHVTLPSTAAGLASLESGVGFDASGVGYRKSHESDVALILADLSTARVDPFLDQKTIFFFCDLVSTDSRETFSFDPRGVVKKAELYLRQLGWADKSCWGPELEFNVFENVTYDFKMNRSSYEIFSNEAVFGSNESSNGFQNLPGKGYHAMPPADSLFDLRSEIATHLREMGIEIKYHHHEGGSAGQVEIEVPMGGLLETADNVMLIKYAAKMTGVKYGKSVTFMPKPLHADHGNGMHVHQNLWKVEQNLFYDQNAYSGLSELALHYIAGLFEHGKALLGFTNPSTNSYRRLVPGFNAPTNLIFGVGNRTATVRIPKYAGSEETKRIEFRPPDASCNIYFCLAAQLLAGIDGIENKMESQEYGSFDEDINSWSIEKKQNVKTLPSNLGQALEALKLDHEFLLRGDVFSSDLIEHWIEYKLKNELIPIQERPHPYEFALYFDV